MFIDLIFRGTLDVLLGRFVVGILLFISGSAFLLVQQDVVGFALDGLELAELVGSTGEPAGVDETLGGVRGSWEGSVSESEDVRNDRVEVGLSPKGSEDAATDEDGEVEAVL